MLSSLFNRAKRFYAYRPGVMMTPIGVGVEGLGLMKPHTDPIDAPYDRRNTVRGDFGPLAGGVNKLVQMGPQVSLQGGGSGLTGAMDLQALAQFQSGKE